MFFRHMSVGVIIIIGGAINISQHNLAIDEPTLSVTENMFF